MNDQFEMFDRDDLRGFTQYRHFFAGGACGALQPDLQDGRIITALDRFVPVPAVLGRQSSSADDPRHLWPDFFRLIRDARPHVVVGEQVSGALGYGWLDGVH